jgi:NIMA (never in mitosis gene a)-related kinase
VGTPFYVAPEMLESSISGLFSDLWALGCIIYELCSGYKMFQGARNQDVFSKILTNEVNYSHIRDKTAVDLIQQLCQIDPSNRIGLKDI